MPKYLAEYQVGHYLGEDGSGEYFSYSTHFIEILGRSISEAQSKAKVMVNKLAKRDKNVYDTYELIKVSQKK